MKIVIAGGSGQIGQVLARSFQGEGHDVVILARQPFGNGAGRFVQWDGRELGGWVDELDAADVLINLAGRSVNCRYDAKHRAEITQSRVDSTKVVGRAIAQARPRPRVWLQAATATIYPHRYDAPNDETSPLADEQMEDVPETWRFSVGVGKAWERAFNEAPSSPSTRKILLRTTLVMNPDRGSVFDVLLGLVRRGLGGRVGDGRQYVSWIHDVDFCRAIHWMIEHDDFSGAVNMAAPNPVPNSEFMRTLREAWGIRFGLPAPKLILEIGTFLMRTESELVLKSRRVIPGRLLEAGFQFEFPDWGAAARDLCHRSRLARS
jgi:uncharacterized protein (TIGR01777 family)